MSQMPPKPTEKTFGTRKAVLLSLPILVAFIVGGYSGELLGHEGFFWPGAIAWGTVIGIIDYNFSILEKLSALGMMGRIILILTSAIITSTVGDHIILKDTVDRKKQEFFKAKRDSLTGQTLYYSGKSGEDESISRLQKDVEEQRSYIKSLRDEMVRECASGVGKRCKNLRDRIIPELKDELAESESVLAELNSEKNGRITSARNERKEELSKITEQESQHDIILEMKLLYKEIFSETATTVMFFLFALMVICIETLPLLLKSGLTYNQVYEQQLEDWRRQCEAIRQAQEAKKQKERIRRSIILRNNRI